MNATKKQPASVGAVVLISVAMLFFLYDVFLQVSPSVMVQQLMHDFHLTALALGNLSASYFYIYTIMQIPVGLLYDRFGVKWLMISAMVICTLGAFFFAFAPGLSLAIVGRVFMGFGSAFAFVGVLQIAATYLSPKKLAMIVGLTTSLGMVGAMVANVLLSKLQMHLGWRGAMVVTGVLGVVITIALGVCLMRFKEKKRKKTKHKAIMPIVWHLLSAMRRPALWVNAIIAFLLYTPVAVFAELWGIPYLKQGLKFSPMMASVVNSMLFFGMALGAPLIGWASDHLQRRKIFIIICSFLGALVLAMIIYVPYQSAWVAMLLFFFSGLLAGSQAITFCLANELTPPTIAATAFAFTNLMINIGVSVFQPVIGGILDAHWVGVISERHVRLFQHGTFSIALTVLPLAYLLSAVMIFFLPETHATPMVKPKKRQKRKTSTK